MCSPCVQKVPSPCSCLNLFQCLSLNLVQPVLICVGRQECDRCSYSSCSSNPSSSAKPSSWASAASSSLNPLVLVGAEDDPHEAGRCHIRLHSRAIFVHLLAGKLQSDIVSPAPAPPLCPHRHLVAGEPHLRAVSPGSVTNRTASVVLVEGLPSALCVEDELVVWLDPHMLVRVPPATHVCSKDCRKTEGGDKCD